MKYKEGDRVMISHSVAGSQLWGQLGTVRGFFCNDKNEPLENMVILDGSGHLVIFIDELLHPVK